MQFFFTCIAALTGVALVAASFFYLVEPDQSKRVLQEFRPLLSAAVVLILAFAACRSGNFGEVALGLTIASVTAYFVREYRKPKKDKRRSSGSAERTPVLPITTRPNEKEASEEETQ